MRKIVLLVSSLLVLFIFSDNYSSAAAEKINIGIASSDESAYGEMISLLSKSSYLQLVERRDLKPLFKELELKQSGAVLGASDSRLKGIDYLIMLDKNQLQYNCRIVKIDTGEIIVGWTGLLSDVADKCIDKIESEVALKSIKALKNDGGLRVSINFRADSYKVGEKIEFIVNSEDSDGYLYLIDIQPDGSVVVLLPNKHKTEFKVHEGEQMLLPDNLGFNFKASEPVGTDRLIAIVTKTPINIFKFGLKAGESITEVPEKSKGVLSRGMSVELNQLPADDWGISSAEIIITK